MSETTRSGKERRAPDLGTPAGLRHGMWDRLRPNPDSFGQMTEGFARFMGTPQFLLWMTVFCAVWLSWNTFMPEELQFDPRALNYTLLTLMLSLQASYAAPLLLLAQNRQDDRDRVIAEQDRRRDEENLADTEYLIREIASLRMAVRDVATRDFVRSEMRDLLQELLEDRQDNDDAASGDPQDISGPGQAANPTAGKKKKKKKVGAGVSRDSRATATGLIPALPHPDQVDSPKQAEPSVPPERTGSSDPVERTAQINHTDNDNTENPERPEHGSRPADGV